MPQATTSDVGRLKREDHTPAESEQTYNSHRPGLDDSPASPESMSQRQEELHRAMELYYWMCQPKYSAAARPHPEGTPGKGDKAERPES
ncbi:hypothetical protein FRC06_004111 [Ceratobasidium sp. 370]|nr:hypothetical protein FRC06_004111 [Ceratobasidium sp. 370]